MTAYGASKSLARVLLDVSVTSDPGGGKLVWTCGLLWTG